MRVRGVNHRFLNDFAPVDLQQGQFDIPIYQPIGRKPVAINSHEASYNPISTFYCIYIHAYMYRIDYGIF